MSARHAPPAASHAAYAPTFRELARAECDALLARNRVGRLAYTFHDRVSIEPIHYAYADGWLVGRTAPGSKLDTLAHHPWIALEVDEVRDTFDWASVVVHGTFYRLHEHGSAAERASWERALPLLRQIVPEALASRDPVPFRDVLFHVHADEVSGRMALPPADASGAPRGAGA